MKLHIQFPNLKTEFKKQTKKKEIEEAWRLWDNHWNTIYPLKHRPKRIVRRKTL